MEDNQRNFLKKKNRKIAIITLLLTGSALFPVAGYAGPEGGQVSAGSGMIAQNGNNTTINQQSQNLSINWQSFNVGAQESVNFNQPNSSSIALNRILGQSPSEILGSINANGQVFILNPNGVLFGQSAQVNVGGLVASTLNISDADAQNGNFKFTNDSNGDAAVINKGKLNAADGGYVALLGPDVKNEGIINVKTGTVALAAGDEVTVNIDNGNMVSYSVDKGALHAMAENRQLVQADGGRVYMTAKAADDIGTAVVNNTGIIEARTVQNQNGVIVLGGDENVGEVLNSGTLDASAPDGGMGGKITVTAHHVLLDDGTKIDASGKNDGGEVYVGGGWQGKDPEIKNASAVVMAPGAEIDVSATDNGDGGTAVLWSDDYTAFAGTIKAEGGANGGTGGKVETSSHGTLQALGSVEAVNGNWLLDPWNVIIASAGASGTTFANSFTPTADSTILNTSIETALDAGNNVTITTGSSGGSAGDITVDAPITYSGTSSNGPTLRFDAANDIIINDIISASLGELNIYMDADNALPSGGDAFFAATGGIDVNGGSVYINAKNLTMTAGSSIDVGGNDTDSDINIDVEDTVTLAANSLIATMEYWSDIDITATTILSNNIDANTPDIVTRGSVDLRADTIGDVSNPIKISGASAYGTTSNFFSSSGRFLEIENSVGSSYVAEIGNQVFTDISFDLGNQANSIQNLKIMSDTTGTGDSHVNLESDGSGVFNLQTGDVRLAATANEYNPNLSLSFDGNITFEDNSVVMDNARADTSEPNLSIGAETMISINPTNHTDLVGGAGTPDIVAPYRLYLTGNDIGTTAGDALDIASGTELHVDNNGGSTYINIVDNTFDDIWLQNVQDTGTFAIHWRDGDHIDYWSDGTKVDVPTISTFLDNICATTAACGMDVTEGNRDITFDVSTGDMVFDDSTSANYAVNTGTGDFTGRLYSDGEDMILGDYAIYTDDLTLESDNDAGNIIANNDYNSSSPVPQITAGNVTINQYTDDGTIGGGTKQLQISQAAGESDNTLNVRTDQGNVFIHELTANHFKTLETYLYEPSAAQNIRYDLNGADDVNFSDDGTQVLINATKVNLSANNRNWYLYTNDRDVQVDSNSLGSGYYNLDVRGALKLNSDLNTNDGDIELYGSDGIYLMKSLTIDSNSDNADESGRITIESPVSGTATGYILTTNADSTDDDGGDIYFYNGANNAGGAYLAGITATSTGANANGTDDGRIEFQNTFNINGDLRSTGDTYITGTIDTEQGNTASGGSITFAGYQVTGSNVTLNTATTASGMNGGLIDLYTDVIAHKEAYFTDFVTMTSTGGAGGAGGIINLPVVNTQYEYGGNNDQTYNGGIINLYGDLNSDEGDITLNGDTRLRTNVAIDTSVYRSYQQTHQGGDVIITGLGVSDGSTGHTLTIDTNNDTGTDLYNGTDDYTHNGGDVSIKAGNVGGTYITSLDVNTRASGDHNIGATDGDIALDTVGTLDNQHYDGKDLTMQGVISTDGGLIDFSDVDTLALSGDTTLKTDHTGGSGNAGTVDLDAFTIQGAYDFTYDVTADGGGASQDLAIGDIGSVTPLTSVTLKAKNLTINAGGITSSGDITLDAISSLLLSSGIENTGGDIIMSADDITIDDDVIADGDLTMESDSDITLNAPVETNGGLVTMAATRNFINNNALDTGIVLNGGRFLVYSTKPADTLEGITPADYTEKFATGYTSGSVPAFASTGNWFIYTFDPDAPVGPVNDPGYIGAINTVTQITPSTNTNDTTSQNNSSQGSKVGVPSNIKDMGTLQSGTIVVENGGINMPQNIVDNTGTGNTGTPGTGPANQQTNSDAGTGSDAASGQDGQKFIAPDGGSGANSLSNPDGDDEDDDKKKKKKGDQ